MTTLHRDVGVTHFDLDVYVNGQVDGGMRLGFVYDTDLFEASTVERLLAHYVRLLESAAATPEEPVSRLPMLGAPERERLLEEWNDNGERVP